MNKVVIAVALVLAGIGAAKAEESFKVLNVELRLPLDAFPPACSRSVDRDGSKQLCWLGKPFEYNGGYLGSVELPDKKYLPRWADNAVATVSINKDRLVEGLTVESFSSRDDIESSIQLRFGRPISRTDYFTNWEHADSGVSVELSNRPKSKEIRFVTAAGLATKKREAEERINRESQRRAAP